MQSETQDHDLLNVLAAPMNAFRSALASARDQIRGTLDEQKAGREGNTDTAAGTLGSFAAGRIDVDRFTSLVSRTEALDAAALARVERAYETLTELSEAKEGLFKVVVEPGQNLVRVVDNALAYIGRAFGAARVYELSRTGAFRESDHASFLEAFPFARWNRAERNLAPPLLIQVNGRDLHPSGLARFLDASIKFLLVVRGESRRAPLVRLITPGTFVAQVDSIDELGLFAAWKGPGVAALVPDTASRSVHDPDGGEYPWDRIKLAYVPEGAPPPMLGGRSAGQQTEEMRQLAALATAPPVPEPVAAPAPVETAAPAESAPEPVAAAAPDPADQLAAWLLSQANLEGIVPE